MLQGFDETANPAQGAPRLAALRARMQAEGLAGFIVPRADAHQGEYVAPRDERLSWLTGFTGSAGFAVILQDAAGVFVDGRYRVQVRAQVDLAHYTPVDWPEVLPGPWLRDHLTTGDVGFDPWLHTADEIARLEAALEGTQIRLRPSANLVDAIWPDQPAPRKAAPSHTRTIWPAKAAPPSAPGWPKACAPAGSPPRSSPCPTASAGC